MSSEIINLILRLQDNVSKGLDTVSKKIDSMTGKIGQMASAFAPVSLASGAALGISIKLASDFDKSLQQAVRGLDLTGSEITDFTKEIRGLQKDLNYQFSSTELTRIATAAGKLGLAKADVGEFTKSIVKMAVATDQTDNIEKLTANAGKISSVFKFTTKQNDDFLNSVNKLDDVTAATSDEILNFTKRVSGVGAVSKLSATELAAFGATMISSGQAPQVAATFMNKYLTVLGAAENLSKPAKKALEELGYSATELSVRFDKDATGTMAEFLNKVKQLDTVAQRRILGKIFGQEHVDSASLLVQQSGELAKQLQNAADKSGNAAKAQNEFNKAANSFAGLSSAFKNQMQEIGIQLGLVILPGLVGILKILSPIVSTIASLTQQFPLVSGVIVSLLTLGAVVAPMMAIVGTIGTISAGIASISPVVASLMVVPSILAGALWGVVAPFAPIIAGVAAVASGGYLIIKNWSPISAFVINLFNQVSTSITGFINWIKSNSTNVSNSFANWFRGIPTHLQTAINSAGNNIISFVNWIQGVGSNIYSSAVNWGKSLISGFINGLQSMYGNAATAMNNFTNWIAQYLPSSDAKKGALSGLSASGQSFADTFMSGLQNSGLGNALGGILQTPGTSSAPPGLIGSASGGTTVINFSPTYNVSAKDADDIIKLLKEKEKALLDMITKSSQKLNRGAY